VLPPGGVTSEELVYGLLQQRFSRQTRFDARCLRRRVIEVGNSHCEKASTRREHGVRWSRTGAAHVSGRKVGEGLLWLVLGASFAGCVPSRESLTAGQIGCPPNEVSTFGASASGGWNQSAETWFAECRGKRFVCSEITTSSWDLDWLFTDSTSSVDSDVSCREELSASAATAASTPRAEVRVASSTPPSGGAGFELGVSRATARERCESAAHLWEEEDGPHASCSGTATALGFAATARLTFCRERLCGVTVSHTPEAHWMRPFTELDATLTAKYGPASKRKVIVPTMCRTDEQFDRCARDGALALSVSWQWPTGQRLRLSLGKASPHTGGSAVRLTYVKAPAAVGLNASAF
jgi:hypothetical protein